MIPARRTLFIPADPAQPIDPFSLDDLYESFSRTESTYVNERTGAFAIPADRAFGYRMIIDQILSNDLDNRVSSNGPMISQERLQFAIELFNNANRSGVWASPGPAFIREKCEKFRATAATMIQKAKENLAGSPDK